MTARVLSGVQPTGNLHLGNYLGAIRNWIPMQETHQCLFCIVDLHAITIPQDPKYLHQSTLDTAAAYIACGIDPKKAIIFNQSMVSGHCELSWILGAITPLGWLNRMTQFKEKAGKHKEQSGLGLYGYPVLMAADILLYNATHVPVGEDQKQHLELTRDIAGAFNRLYNIEYFKLPEPLITGHATRVMSLKDGTKKMSKSDTSDYSRINLADSEDDIRQKIKKAKSDMFDGITYDPEKRPDITNLLNIYISISGESKESVCEKFAESNSSNFKNILSETLIEHLRPIKSNFEDLRRQNDYILDILKDGSQKASDLAISNLNNIKDIIGFVRA